MKKTSLVMFVSLLSLAGAGFAQSSEIRESTDPDKIREIEQHAAELKARGHNPSMQSSGASTTEQATHPKKAKKRHAAKKHKAKPASGEAAGTSGSSGAGSAASNQSMSDSAGQQQSGPSGAQSSINGPGTPQKKSPAKDQETSGAPSSK